VTPFRAQFGRSPGQLPGMPDRPGVVWKERAGRFPNLPGTSKSGSTRSYRACLTGSFLSPMKAGWSSSIRGSGDTFGLADRPSDLKAFGPKTKFLSRIRSSYAIQMRPWPSSGRSSRIIGQFASQEVALSRERTVLRDFIPLRLGGKESGRLWIHVDITGLEEGGAEPERE